MQEIKMRIWDGKEYRYPPPIGEWDFEDCELFAGYTKRAKARELFTGLKDKNGREIYEGDIIYTQHRIISEQHPLAVAWDNDYSRFCVTHPELLGEPASLGNLNPRFWAVIGNIHENKELLGHTPGPSAE